MKTPNLLNTTLFSGSARSYSRPALLSMALSVLMLTNVPLQASEADDRIETAAKKSFIFRNFLSEESVTTEAKDGVVKLGGTVSNEMQRLLAEDTVKGLTGVTEVVSQIKVREGPEKPPSDTILFIKVKNTLAVHRSVSAMNTKVEVKEGVVTLKGEARSLAQKDLTGEYVNDIEGIKGLKNEMTVAASAAPSVESLADRIDDASITASVRMVLWSHRSTALLKLGIVTTEGNVALAGVASSQAEKDLVTKYAMDVVGVLNVLNSMTVNVTASK